MDVKSKLSNSEITPLVHENQRLQTEIDSISAHSQWLETELKRTMEENAELRKNHSSQTVSLQNDLYQLQQEKEADTSRILALERSEERLQQKVEQLSKQVLQQKNDQLDAALAAEQELTAERRLVELQKEQLDRLEKKHDDVVREMEFLQKKAKEALEDSRRERQQRRERESEQVKLAIEEQSHEFDLERASLREQLTTANKRRLEAEDNFLKVKTINGGGTTLAITDGSSEGILGLTDLSAQLAQAKTSVATERARRKQAELRLERVFRDIEAKAPEYTRQRQEYELALGRLDEYQRRLKASIDECTVCRAESRELNIELSKVLKAKRSLEQETVELAKQVQVLLMSRSGVEFQSNDIPTSIEEMQSQNQRLLGEHRRLMGTVKELEEKLKSDEYRQNLEAAEKELSSLRDDRQKQDSLVAGIVQQRDLYRALLSQNDSRLLGSEEDEVTAMEMTRRQSERAKALEKKNQELEEEVAASTGKLDRVNREKEVISERLSRNETMVINLTKSVDNLQMELSTAKSDAARTKAECSYYTERANRIEESLRNAREEIEHVTNAKSELQRINTDLQAALTKANAECSRLETQTRQVRRLPAVT
mgnify:CR=1 FL=1